MPSFQVSVSNTKYIGQHIKNGKQWKTIHNYHEKNKIVDINGKSVGKDYKGRKFHLIVKQQREFTGGERFGRGLIATISVLFTFGLSLISESMQKLYTKSHKSFRIALEIPKKDFKTADLFKTKDTKIERKQDQEPAPVQDFAKLLQDKNREEFARAIKSLSPQALYHLVSKDGLGFSEHFKYGCYHTIKKMIEIIFNSLNGEQLQVIFKSVLQIKNIAFDLFVELIKTIKEEENQEELFGYALEAFDSNSFVKCFKILDQKSYSVEMLVPFFSFIVHSSVQKGDWKVRFAQLKESLEDWKLKSLFSSSKITKQLSLSEWKRISQWCDVHAINFEKLPETLAKFDNAKGDKQAVFAILDDIFSFNTSSEKENSLPVILNEMTIEQVAEYIDISKTFTKPYVFEWALHYSNIVHALPIEKHKEFLNKTLFISLDNPKSLEKAEAVLQKLKSGYGFFNETTNKSLIDELNELINSTKSKQLLEEFKKVKGYKEVGQVLKKSLDKGGEGFKLIAETITKEEILTFVDPQNNLFGLDDFQHLLPLEGVFKYLPIDKLQVFVKGTLTTWTLENVASFFYKFVKSSVFLEDKNKQIIAGTITDWLSEDPIRSYVLFPTLWSFANADAELLAYILAQTDKLDPRKAHEILEIAYKTNATLLEKVLQTGLLEKGAIKRWLINKNQGQPMPLASLNDEKEAIEEFKKCKTNPDHVRAFLKGALNDALKKSTPLLSKVMAEMTVDEVASYSKMENNCFNVFPNHTFMSYKEEKEVVLTGLKSTEKQMAFLKSTIERKDCEGRIGLYVMLLVWCNTNEEFDKDSLFTTCYSAIKEAGQLQKLLHNWLHYNDGSLDKGKVVPAMKKFAATCLKMGCLSDLGILAVL